MSSAFCLLRPLPSSFSAKSSFPAFPNFSGNNSLTVGPVPLIAMPWSGPRLLAMPRMLKPPELGAGVILSASFAERVSMSVPSC